MPRRPERAGGAEKRKKYGTCIKWGLIALYHAVAYPNFGKDILGLRRIFLYLPANVCHVDPQDLIVPLLWGPHSSFMMKS